MPIVELPAGSGLLAHATVADLEAWTGKDAPAEAERLLRRASEIIDWATTSAYDADEVTSIAIDLDASVALRDATCAQVEHWIIAGEANDIDGMAGQEVSVNGLSVTRPSRLAPRARQQLALFGLL